MDASLRRCAGVLVVLVLTTLAAACGQTAERAAPTPPESSAASSSSPSATSTSSPAVSAVAMKPPGKLEDPLLSPDVLVLSQRSLPDSVIDRVRHLRGVRAVEVFSMAQFYVEEQPIRYAAVDPASFRRYTPQPTAQTTKLWDRVAGGEIMVRPDLGEQVPTPGDYVRVGSDKDDPRIHIGALAPLSSPVVAPYLDAVVNEKWAPRLDMPDDNAMFVSTGETSPQSIQKQLRRIAATKATVQILGPNPDLSGFQTAILTSGSLSSAVGTFSYTVNPDGTVNPDPSWVRDYIRTEQVPILGGVTCNKAMLIQLRAALREVVASGLAGEIHPGEYGGCYVPRFIARDPSKGLSFHTWGTAIDLNVAGNQRGTVGLIDRRIVGIFARWGFNWGGTWHYTDPMHFEMARIVRVG
ncbi:MAG TPA: M15 family metallopeptidase [Marmoricola sp.]|jgi:hypothetical protein|nr:M15 family metallopeptidase [Marmoricola sp.]